MFDCDKYLETAIAARNKPKNPLKRGTPGFGWKKLTNYEQRVCQALPWE